MTAVERAARGGAGRTTVLAPPLVTSFEPNSAGARTAAFTDFTDFTFTDFAAFDFKVLMHKI